jgi:ERCC4-type nuclease
MNKKINGIVDSREKVDYTNIGINANLKFDYMECCDIAFDEISLGIENKTCSDLYFSYIDEDKRLFKQMERMKQYKYKYLFLYLYDYDNIMLNMKLCIDKILTKIELDYGVLTRKITKLFDDDNHYLKSYAYVLNGILDKINIGIENEDLINLPIKKRERNTKKEKIISIIMNAKGVGLKTALSIAESVDSINVLSNMSLNELTNIRLVTLEKAKNIYEMLH